MVINSCKNNPCRRGLLGNAELLSFPTALSEAIYKPKICYMLEGQLVRRSELSSGTNQGASENKKISNLSVWKFGYNSHLLKIKNAVASDNGSDPIAQEINECLLWLQQNWHLSNFLSLYWFQSYSFFPLLRFFTFNSFFSVLHLLLLARSIIFIWGFKFLAFNPIMITC